ncbi:MAG: malonyl-CoA decarboxylase family protein [Elusimicrobia bacterium]|nr:malonyl-CoA decarboxylase family protein [Elusimicrobiota bacterium]
MEEERHFNFAQLRHRVSDSISKIFVKFGLVTPLGEKLEKAVSLLSTDQTSYSDSLRIIRKFYDESDEHKIAFFHLLDRMESRRIEHFLDQIYAVTGSPKWLISLREDFLRLKKKLSSKMENLNDSFKEYFSKIFNFQYLVTRPCDANSTSIKLLKFIAEKEGVHPSQHWWSFEKRLSSPDRIILSLEHFKMPGVPVVYVEIALTKGLVRNVLEIFAEKAIKVSRANTAIFYSINATFKGLGGIGLGRKMIIRAKEFLKKNYPEISLFSTLSPLPKFRNYLETVLKSGKSGFSLSVGQLDKKEKNVFFGEEEIITLADVLKVPQVPSEILRKIISDDKLLSDPRLSESVKKPMEKIALYYLEKEKKKVGKEAVPAPAFDPVENFHLSNGAYIGGVNCCGNLSPKGLKESFGMTVNYIYDEKKMDENKLKYSVGKIPVKLL